MLAAVGRAHRGVHGLTGGLVLIQVRTPMKGGDKQPGNLTGTKSLMTDF